MYGIIDCDNCYVSCERVFRPDLNGKPVVVLSNNDGCVVARSNEAKRMGIKAGIPFYQLEEQFPDHKIAVFPDLPVGGGVLCLIAYGIKIFIHSKSHL